MKLSTAEDATNAGVLTCDRGFEPLCTVIVRNERLHTDFTATADKGGLVTLPFEAEIGDPLHLTLVDLNGKRTDLGLVRYAPTCVKAGPLAQSQRQGEVQHG